MKNPLPSSPSKTPSRREGEGGNENDQSKIKLLRPDQAWHPRRGAPLGNRNNPATAKTLLLRRIRDLKRRVRAALKAFPP